MKRIVYIVSFVAALLCAGVASVQAVDINTETAANHRNKTLEGRHFWVSVPDVALSSPTSKTAWLMLTNTSDVDATVTITSTNSGKALAAITVPAGGYKKASLDYASACHTAANANKATEKRSYKVTSTAPISCTMFVEEVNKGNVHRDATQVIPTRDLGMEYMIQGYPQGITAKVVIVATEASTSVRIVPKAGDVKKITIATAGYTYLVTGTDLTGSMICSNKPVAVFVANASLKVPMHGTNVNNYTSNYTLEQALPLSRMGKKFYVAVAENTKWNGCVLTGTQDETTVTVKFPNTATQTITLGKGETYEVSDEDEEIKTLLLSSVLANKSNVVIEADKPIMVSDYLTSGAMNQYDILDNVRNFFSGAVSNTFIPSWEMRVKDAAFTSSNITSDATDLEYQFVQVVVPTSEKNQLLLDGAAVPTTVQWTSFGGDAAMSYANIPLANTGYHRLTTTGTGFVGMTYGLASGLSYMHSLSYNPEIYRDKLYLVENGDDERIQFIDGTPQVKVICDSVELNFKAVNDPLAQPYDTLRWQIYESQEQFDAKGKSTGWKWIMLSDSTQEGTPSPATFSHQFILPVDEDGNKPSNPIEYLVAAVYDRAHHTCDQTDMSTPAEREYLRAIVRVVNKYNDTIDHVMCVNDSFPFFMDDQFRQGMTAESNIGGFVTRFVSTKRTADNAQPTFKTTDGTIDVPMNGKVFTFTREYQTAAGCDSLMTIRLFVCDTANTANDRIDTTLNVGQILRFKDEKKYATIDQKRIDTDHAKKFAGPNANLDGLYFNAAGNYIVPYVLKTHTCVCDQLHDDTFIGCDSVIYVHVTVNPFTRDTLRMDFCDSTFNVTTGKMQKSGFLWRNNYTSSNKSKERFNYTWPEDHVYTTPGNTGSKVKNVYFVEENKNVPANKIDSIACAYVKAHAGVESCTFTDTTYAGWKWNGTLEGKGKYILILTPHFNSLQRETLPVCDSETDYVWAGAPDESKLEYKFQSTDSYKRTTASLYRYVHKVDEATHDTIVFTRKSQFDEKTIEALQVDLFLKPTYDLVDTVYLCSQDVVDPAYFKPWYLPAGIKTADMPSSFNGKIASDTKGTYVKLREDGLTGKVHFTSKAFNCDSTVTLFTQVLNNDDATTTDTIVSKIDSTFFVGWIVDKDGNRVRFTPKDSTLNKKYPYQRQLVQIQGVCDAYETWNVYVVNGYTATGCRASEDDEESLRFFSKNRLPKQPASGKLYDVTNHRWIDADSIPLVVEPGVYRYVDSLNFKINTTQLSKIWMLDLNVKERERFATWDTISQEQTIKWGPTLYGGSKVKNDAGVRKLGYVTDTEVRDTILYAYRESDDPNLCDTMMVLNLTIAPVFRDTLYDYVCATCATCAYTWMGTDADGEEFIREDNLKSKVVGDTVWFNTANKIDGNKTVLGYDSVYYLGLIGAPSYDKIDIFERTCQDKITPDGYYPEDHKLYRYDIRTGKIIGNEPIYNIYNNKVGTFDYLDSLTANIAGCDSVIILHLTVDSVYTTGLVDTICEDQILSWQGSLYVGPLYEQYHGEVPNPDHLPVINLNKAEMQLATGFKKTTYKYEGSIHDTVKSVCGCDSVLGLTLYMHTKDSVFIPRHTVQDNDAKYPDILLSSPLAYDPTRPGYKQRVPYDTTIVSTLPDIYGCDSIVYDQIHVIPSYLHQDTIFGCPGEEGTWSRNPGTTYIISEKTEYRPDPNQTVVKSVLGADSLYQLVIQPKESAVYDYRKFPVHVCQSKPKVLEGKYTVTADNEALYDMKMPDGSPATLDFTVIRPSGDLCSNVAYYSLVYHREYFGDTVKVSICEGTSFTWSEWSGKVYTEAGIYEDTLKRHDCDCDSIRILQLSVTPTYHHVYYDTICLGQEYTWTKHDSREVKPTKVGTHKEYVSQPMPTGCDSIVELFLYVRPIATATTKATMCKDGQYEWEGRTYVGEESDMTGYPVCHVGETLRDTVIHENPATGCDSILYLELSSLDVQDHELGAVTTCEGTPYMFNGKPLTETGEYFDTVRTSTGCVADRYHVFLTVQPAEEYHLDTTLCTTESLFWHGKLYSSETAAVITDKDEHQNQYGCDSTYYLSIRFVQAYYYERRDTFCELPDTITWMGKPIQIDMSDTEMLTRDTTFVFENMKKTTVGGCDSISRFLLTLKPVAYDTLSATICVGETYDFFGQQLSKAGEYQYSSPNRWGCNIITTLYLTTVEPSAVHLNAPAYICQDQSVMKLPVMTDAGDDPLTAYWISFDAQAKRLGFKDQDSVPLPVDDTIRINVPKTIIPGHYSAKMYFDNQSCSDKSLMTAAFDFEVRYTSKILQQVMSWNDVIGINEEEFHKIVADTIPMDSIQFSWYRNDTLIVGATDSYLYVAHFLDEASGYSLSILLPNDSTPCLTCPLEPKLDYMRQPESNVPYVSVAPTVVSKSNPVVDILSINPGQFRVINSVGALVESGRFLPDEHRAHEVRLPAIEGLYIFHLTEEINNVQSAVEVLVVE